MLEVHFDRDFFIPVQVVPLSLQVYLYEATNIETPQQVILQIYYYNQYVF